MRAKKGLLVLACAVCVCIISWVPSYAADILKIGVIAPMTGPCAETGEGMKGASILAAEEINAAGGILGRKIELFFGDDESKAAAGASVMERLINRDKVDIIIGTMNTNVGLATMEVAAKYEIPFILTCPAAWKISEKILNDPKKYRYTIKTDPSTYGYGIGYAEFVQYLDGNNLVEFRNRTVAVLSEHNDWGASLAEAEVKEFKKLGWEVVANEVHDIAETNFFSLLSKIKALNPDILITNETSASAAASLARQFLEQGLPMHLFQSYGALKPGYLEALGTSGNGICAMQLIYCHTEECDEFTGRYAARWGAAKFDVCGNMQYDMFYLAKTAYEKAGSLDKDKWIEAVLNTEMRGTIGNYVYDKASHETKVGKDFIPSVVMQLRNGKWHYMMPEYMRKEEYIKPSWVK